MLYVRKTIVGPMAIGSDGKSITHLYLPKNTAELGGFEKKEPPVVKEAFRQLELYLAGKLKKFDLPLKAEGTPFMKQVWEKLVEVPYGKTASYKDLAIASGNPKAVRAVGMANARNPIAIFIPCHRIIGANGKLVGYGGGLELKTWLLELEAAHASEESSRGR
ncbi:MAG: methylated-DNA--[protein]-cysteine S-methyltransferase [Aminobacteriaceae bacterium]|uniref:methylated-DNA--[protein]-cysteine S-methyltransferase n=1 Tax=Aminivibrio sp. TaxID=1872489 RepID=UPI00345E941D